MPKKIPEKLYKFRSLATELEYDRMIEILRTNQFHYSSFYKLNDPMEGVFSHEIGQNFEWIAGQKAKFKICSFSWRNKKDFWFNSLLMRSHYADAMRWVAIEITLNPNNTTIHKIIYRRKNPRLKNKNNKKEIQTILTRKHLAWSYEDEYRFLISSDERKQDIWVITALYFWEAYHNLENENELKELENNNIVAYENRRDELISWIKEQKLNIKLHKVYIKDWTVETKPF